MYGNIAGADIYWTARLGGSRWLALTSDVKSQALQSSTDVINRQRYIEDANTDNTNGDHFPEGDDTEVPDNVINAAYELALCLVTNPPISQFNQTNVKRSKQGQTETEFFGLTAPWTNAGIPCQSVWQMLEQYMVDPAEITIVRES